MTLPDGRQVLVDTSDSPRRVGCAECARVLGGRASGALEAFDGDRCDRAVGADWVAVPTSDRLWATERDRDVMLSTAGDGVFVREP
ncbi:MAG: hypothetical protein M3O46_18125 [Myxococcota bacterium]|nr:hypothetical protein [Myxococcota bacterium]